MFVRLVMQVYAATQLRVNNVAELEKPETIIAKGSVHIAVRTMVQDIPFHLP